VLVERLIRDIKSNDIVEFRIDSLEEPDLERLVDYFDEFGLWGDESTLPRYRKLRNLRVNCEAEWHAILLKLLNSPYIIEKLSSLFETLKKNGVYRDPIVRLLILAVLGYTPPTSTLVDICGEKILEAGFRKDLVVQELVDFKKSSAGVRSSVTAEILLKQVVDPNLAIQAVIGLLRRADTLEQTSYNSELFKNLIRFSNFHNILPEKERGRAGMRIYEAVKHLNNCKQSPLFWLQYAIASLVAQNFERAETYFGNAYAFAAEMYLYDTHQIDNHYARFLVERAIYRDDAAHAMAAFREARILIFNQLGDVNERRHYPFRVASGWWSFYSHFENRLSDSERSEIRSAANYVQQRIDTLPADRSGHRSVVDCGKAMLLILKVDSSGAKLLNVDEGRTTQPSPPPPSSST
jgi:hypothetical protein